MDEKMQELLRQMIECEKMGDTEDRHCKADDILCEALEHLGYKELVEAFNKLDKWYS